MTKKHLLELLEQVEREDPNCQEFIEKMKKKIQEIYGEENEA